MQKFSPLQYLKIDISNHMGLDKLSWNQRIEWVDTHEKDLEKLIDKADEPAQYCAVVDAYRDAQQGKEVHHAIALDCTSSGYQWLSVLSSDRQAAELCNVLPSGSRRDLYTEIYKEVQEQTGENELISRDIVKKAIMTAGYGSVSGPKQLFGDNYDVFNDVMNRKMPKVWELNQFFVNNWINDRDTIKWIMPDNFHVNLTIKKKIETEFAFKGKIRTFIHEEISPSDFGRSLGPGICHSLDSLAAREIITLAMYDLKKIDNIKQYMNQKKKTINLSESNPHNRRMVLQLVKLYEDSKFLSARILDYIDESTIHLVPEEELRELIYLLPKKPFQVYCVHDAYHVHPNYGNDIRWLFIAQLAKVSRSNMLQFILRQMYENEKIKVEKDETMWKDILNSEYALS